MALEALEEALLSTTVPPPSPATTPSMYQKTPHPPKHIVHTPYSAKTLQLIWDNHGGGVQHCVDGVLHRRAMFRFAVQNLKKNSLLVWQEGMRIDNSHFLNRHEEHATLLLATIYAAPKPPHIPKPPPTFCFVDPPPLPC